MKTFIEQKDELRAEIKQLENKADGLLIQINRLDEKGSELTGQLDETDQAINDKRDLLAVIGTEIKGVTCQDE